MTPYIAKSFVVDRDKESTASEGDSTTASVSYEMHTIAVTSDTGGIEKVASGEAAAAISSNVLTKAIKAAVSALSLAKMVSLAAISFHLAETIINIKYTTIIGATAAEILSLAVTIDPISFQAVAAFVATSMDAGAGAAASIAAEARASAAASLSLPFVAALVTTALVGAFMA